MPLQNRVDPFGNIFRTSARGTFMGNRGGALHNDAREIVRTYKSRRWITCVLEFRGRHRAIMSPGRYTELFFLDEAVAFAAGHRPCAECRHERFKAFQRAWSHNATADEIDLDLHAARSGDRHKQPLRSLPNGTFVEIDGCAWLASKSALLLWSPEGYIGKISLPRDRLVTVLTPRPIVDCFRRGYQPELHPSAQALA
ncbi:MAG TPA: hypothetical protein VFW44_05420 [Bryobacteraceae bacterium]|nr:hypothetical protein [Bryobacteraceae bacterium]